MPCTSTFGNRVSYGVIAFPTNTAHDFEMFTATATELEKGDTVKKRRKRLILVSLSAGRLSNPSVYEKIFTRFMDRLSFEFALSNPQRTPVLSFKGVNIQALRFGLKAIRSSSKPFLLKILSQPLCEQAVVRFSLKRSPPFE